MWSRPTGQPSVTAGCPLTPARTNSLLYITMSHCCGHCASGGAFHRCQRTLCVDTRRKQRWTWTGVLLFANVLGNITPDGLVHTTPPLGKCPQKWFGNEKQTIGWTICLSQVAGTCWEDNTDVIAACTLTCHTPICFNRVHEVEFVWNLDVSVLNLCIRVYKRHEPVGKTALWRREKKKGKKKKGGGAVPGSWVCQS